MITFDQNNRPGFKEIQDQAVPLWTSYSCWPVDRCGGLTKPFTDHQKGLALRNAASSVIGSRRWYIPMYPEFERKTPRDFSSSASDQTSPAQWGLADQIAVRNQAL